MVLWGRNTMSTGEQKMFKVDLRKTFSLGARLLVGGVSAIAFTSSAAVAQTLPTSGPAANGQPEWFFLQTAPRGPAPGGAPAPGRGAPAGGGRGAAAPIQACIA